MQKWLVMLAGLLVVSCESPNVFHNVPAGQPHAVLVSGSSFRGREITPFFINDRPTSFWRNGNTFRIAPGVTTIQPIDSSEPYGYEPVMFVAKEGFRYILKPGVKGEKDVAYLEAFRPGPYKGALVATSRRKERR